MVKVRLSPDKFLIEPPVAVRLVVTTVPVNIKPSTKYYVFADVAGITTINLGGSEIRYNANDSCLEITTPSIVNENTISFIGDYSVSNVMLRTDNRLDIKYE